MDQPCAQWQAHVAEKWTTLDPDLREIFSSLFDIDSIFNFALSLATQVDLDYFQSFSAEFSVKKSPPKSAISRENGNKRFKERDYVGAALHYSQGVCLSPRGSEELALCYANRSAALYHLKYFQECLADIDRAFKSGYPANLAHKLEDRRSLCLNELATLEASSEGAGETALTPTEGATASAEHMGFGICSKVFVDCSAAKGRHMLALEDLPPGEVILTDRAYGCILIPGSEEVKGEQEQEAPKPAAFGCEHRRCHQCLNETLCCVPCDGCSYSRYCSESCRQKAWEDHHRWECPLGEDLMATGLMSQLALRMALKAGLPAIQVATEAVKAKEDETGPVDPTDDLSDGEGFPEDAEAGASMSGDAYLKVFGLLHHAKHHSVSLRFLYANTAAALYLKLSLPEFLSAWIDNRSFPEGSGPSDEPDGAGVAGDIPELWLLGSAILRHMLQLRCNAQAVTALQDAGSSAASLVVPVQELRIATAIFPTLSLLNHSCSPNISVVFDTGSSEAADTGETGEGDEPGGVTVTVRVAKAIAPGHEILHCYGPHCSRMRRQERQRRLREQYYFNCQCEACDLPEVEGERHPTGATGGPDDHRLLCAKCGAVLKKDDDGDYRCTQPNCDSPRIPAAEVSRMLKDIEAAMKEGLKLLEDNSPGDALQVLLMNENQSPVILTDVHPLQGQLADAIARAYASLGNWEKAAFYLKRSLMATTVQYGEESIEAGHQLFKLSQLYFNGGMSGPALDLIPRVRHILCLHLGPHCIQLQVLKAMEYCLET